MIRIKGTVYRVELKKNCKQGRIKGTVYIWAHGGIQYKSGGLHIYRGEICCFSIKNVKQYNLDKTAKIKVRYDVENWIYYRII